MLNMRFGIRYLLLIFVSILVSWLLLSYSAVAHLALAQMESNSMKSPVIAMARTGKMQFTLVVVNPTKEPISIGKMHSVLGFDQFLVTIDAGDERFSVERKAFFISNDGLQPLTIPSGSFCEIKIDLEDDTWLLEKGKRENVNNWKSIRIQYLPELCSLPAERKERGVWEKEMSTELCLVDRSKEE
jgi:hypothetical protein